MKLYDVPEKLGGVKIRVLGDIKIPPAALPINAGDEIIFYNIDGMYSYCEKDGEALHLVAWAEVEVI